MRVGLKSDCPNLHVFVEMGDKNLLNISTFAIFCEHTKMVNIIL
jgi:hypothetical protein